MTFLASESNLRLISLLSSNTFCTASNKRHDEFVVLLCRALWCLDDVPFRNKIPHLKKLPGQIYTIDEQCQHDFGSNSRYCSGVSELRLVSCFNHLIDIH